MPVRVVKIGTIKVGGKNPLVFFAGPCVIESETLTLKIAERLCRAFQRKGIPLVFKSSYDKANRTSLHSYRGPGLKKGLKILQKVKEETGLPVMSDVHSVAEISDAAGVLDVLQIPAFLCRQTDLLVSASRTGKPINIKKGQFMAPWDMKYVVEKVTSTGNQSVLITERGATFGYNNLVVDIRSIPVMQEIGYPVVFDATHGVQLPGARGESSSGERRFAGPLACAAVAAGCDAVFMEVHECPEKALCDGPNMLDIKEAISLVTKLSNIRDVIQRR
jgi:2-dehydro-3-deoxyphosphooctonate aldolase (KDO 8-P synthase)